MEGHTHPKSLCTDYNDQTRPDQTRPASNKDDVWVVVVVVVVISLGLDVQKHERELRGRELQASKKIIGYL